MKNWLVFEILGLIIGGFISGLISNRLDYKIQRGPRLKKSIRLGFAFLGGVLFSYGAALARGCTSGAALSGMAVLSTAGFVTMIFIFGAAYVAAIFFKRLWI